MPLLPSPIHEEEQQRRLKAQAEGRPAEFAQAGSDVAHAAVCASPVRVRRDVLLKLLERIGDSALRHLEARIQVPSYPNKPRSIVPDTTTSTREGRDCDNGFSSSPKRNLSFDSITTDDDELVEHPCDDLKTKRRRLDRVPNRIVQGEPVPGPSRAYSATFPNNKYGSCIAPPHEVHPLRSMCV